MDREQPVWIPASLVETRLFSTCMARAKNISAWFQIAICRLMPASLAQGQLVNPGTTHGFKRLESFSIRMLSVEATKAATWDNEADHLKFFYDGLELGIPEGYPSVWKSFENNIKVERTSTKYSVLITLPEVAEISINVVPVTMEDDRIHNYQIPPSDCFAHLKRSNFTNKSCALG
ncbi:Structural constituent of cell wall [Forsythia ovata]|uniref:Structural constituent of cell wall n=1 Tax=Forsythia ovata TaxID=205694 RepID=A0ABD1Q911_9LAMI